MGHTDTRNRRLRLSIHGLRRTHTIHPNASYTLRHSPTVGLTPAQVAVIIYLIAAGIVNLFVATGLLLHWNKARILAILLSHAPVIGVILYTIYQTLVNQLITAGQARVIIQLQPLIQTASLLTFTGISFPSIAPLIGTYSFGTNPTIFLLALLNIGIPIYLKNKHIKTQFQQTPKPT